MYCKQAIALAINIKNHFDRVVNQQVDRTVVTQMLLPFRMPTHMENLRKVRAGCKLCFLSPNTNQSCDDEVSFVECSRCISNIEFDEFATSLLTGISAKTAGKKRSASGLSGVRKRAMEDEDDYLVTARAKRCLEPRSTADYSPMDCMHQAVGLQNARRVLRSSKEAALEEISSSFDFDDAGSALLLELKETMKVDQEASDASSSASADSFKPSMGCYTVADAGRTTSSYPCTNLDAPHTRDDLRIITSPFTYEKRSSPEDQLDMDTPSGHMQDFLYSCYRDGIYPSPVMPYPPSATLRGSAYLTPNGPRLSGGDREDKSDSSEAACAGTEVDTGGAEQFTRNTDTSHLPGGLLEVSLEAPTTKLAEHQQSSAAHGEQFFRESRLQPYSVPGTDSDAAGNGDGNTVVTSPQQGCEQHGAGGQPMVLAYDELQQLLTHLLAEARD